MLTKTTMLYQQFLQTRQYSEALCKPLAVEDFVVQPTDFVSPPKWHLGHTTWYFEQFVLKDHVEDYAVFDKNFAYLFNSYYESVGVHWVRANRGNLSRPTVNRIHAYRQYVNEAMEKLLRQDLSKELQLIIEIGINHEQQHQELLLTDIKYILGTNPLFPVYQKDFQENPIQSFPEEQLLVSGGIYEIGLTHGTPGFRYDNEMGRHKVYVDDFLISNKLVTNKEYLEFMKDGGYAQVLLWHAAGWDWQQQNHVVAPLYWYQRDGCWWQYTLAGLQALDLEAPVCHISYYEAFAFAQWKKKRLPTEAEWEIAQEKFDWGSRWEWTASAYTPYPDYRKPEGAIGEYNGKFMVNQNVLRGGSVATPPGHTRPTYRNFFHPPERWQFFGIRLAK